MPRFVNILEKPEYFDKALLLYLQNLKFLEDDFAFDGRNKYKYFEDLIKRISPFFYLVLEDCNLTGIIYLDNIIGDSKKLHSAELVTCFDKKYWGFYTKICAIIFLKYCFQKLKLEKIKALVYPENFRVKNLLKFAGFKFEGLLKGETVRNNKLQDVEIYSCRKAEK